MADRKVLLLLDDATGPEQVVTPLLPNRTELGADDQAAFGSSPWTTLCSSALTSSHDRTPLACLSGSPLGRDLPAHRSRGRKLLRLSISADPSPLAIRVIAGRAAAQPAWSLDDLVIDLAAAKSRLALLRAGNISVAAAFDLSYTGLTIRQRRLFRRLALHPGSDIDLYAAAALDGSNLATVQQRGGGLYDQHLIEEPARAASASMT